MVDPKASPLHRPIVMVMDGYEDEGGPIGVGGEYWPWLGLEQW